MAEDISLIDEIKTGNFATSLIATFNAYLPFYEDVLLRHLLAKGCRHNVVMMDARQCAEALGDPGHRPRFAGVKYTLIPVRAGGAFHPKIILLAGRSRGVLLVGSHNLTMSGYGINRELTTRFEYSAVFGRTSDQITLATFQAAYRFLKDWAGEVNEMVSEMFRAIERLAPWLREPLPADTETPFAASTPKGQPLWKMIEHKLPLTAERITVIGPFFDSDLAFLKHLDSQMSPKELIVGIEPERVDLNRNAQSLLPRARFVDAGALGRGSGYLHAKAILIESEDGKEILITGSANPSRAAWLAEPADRNAEAVVIQTDIESQVLFEIRKLAQQPELDGESWAQISRKHADDQQKQSKVSTPLLAIAFGDRFEIAGISKARRQIDEVRALDANRVPLGSVRNLEWEDGCLHIPVAEPTLCDESSLLNLYAENELQIQAIVHHFDELSRQSQTDAQRAFQRALATLSSEAPMLDEMLRILNKVILEDDSVGTSDQPGSARSSDSSSEEAEGTTKLSEFEISLSDSRKGKRKRRLYSGGDLGLVLDTLIHGLGKGLRSEPREPSVDWKSEEDLVGSEDEEMVSENRVDGLELVRLCRRKLQHMFRRMLGQLEAAADGGKALRSVQQLAAVLVMINYLRVQGEKSSWVPRGESLLPHDRLREFFLGACWHLYSRQRDLLRKSLDSLGENDCLEVDYVRGLLLWVAWECGFDIRSRVSGTNSKEIREELRGLDRLLHLVPDVSMDADATEVARQAISLDPRFIKYDDWLSAQLEQANYFVDLMTANQEMSNRLGEPKRGDIVYLKTDASKRFTVVIDTDGRKAKLAENEDIWYASEYLVVVEAPSEGMQQAQSTAWSLDEWKRLLWG